MSRTPLAARRRCARTAVVGLALAAAAPLSLVAPATASAAPAWTAVGPAGVVASDVVVSPGHPQVAYAATSSGVLRSVDGGATWAQTALTDATSDVAVDPDDPAAVVALSSSYVLRSTDGGDAWTPDAFGTQGLDLAWTADNLVVMDRPNNVTWDDGTGWSAHNEIESAYDANGNQVEWGSRSQAYAIAASDGAIPGTGDDMSGVVYLALDRGLVRIDFASSSGMGFRLMPIGAPRAVEVSPDGSVVLAGEQLSDDGGLTWEHLGSLPGLARALALDASPASAAAYAGVDASGGGESVFRRTPAGADWTPLGLLDKQVNEIAVGGGGLIAATSTGLFRYAEPSTPAVPTLSSVAPGSAQACTAACSAVSVTVSGSAFQPTTVGRLDGQPLATVVSSATQLTVTVPAALLATARTAVLDVATGPSVSSSLPFFVTETGAAVLGTATGSNTDPAADANVASPDGAMSATGDGAGSLSLAGYSGNPVATPAPTGAGSFFDVYVAPGSAFATVTVVNCALDPANTSHVVYWWDGARWSPVSDQSYDPATGCVTLTFDAATSPSTTQLTGTVFADVPAGRAAMTLRSAPGTPVTARPGRWLAVGYRIKLSSKSTGPTDVAVADGSIALAARCANGSPRTVTVPLQDRRYAVPAGSKAWYATSDTDSPSGFQGAIRLPDLCGGQSITLTGAGTFAATVTTSPRATAIEVQVHQVVPSVTGRRDVDCSATTANPEPGTRDCQAGWRPAA